MSDFGFGMWAGTAVRFFNILCISLCLRTPIQSRQSLCYDRSFCPDKRLYSLETIFIGIGIKRRIQPLWRITQSMYIHDDYRLRMAVDNFLVWAENLGDKRMKDYFEDKVCRIF